MQLVCRQQDIVKRQRSPHHVTHHLNSKGGMLESQNLPHVIHGLKRQQDQISRYGSTIIRLYHGESGIFSRVRPQNLINWNTHIFRM